MKWVAFFSKIGSEIIDISNKLRKNPDIINGHPGLITLYPQLKGLNPQQKSYQLNHPDIGVGLHKVIAEVDSGEIIKESRTKTTLDFQKNLIILRKLSLNIWIDFLKSIPNLI